MGPLVPRLPDRLFTRNKKIVLAPEMLISALKQLEDRPARFSIESRQDDFDLLLISRRNVMSSNSWFHNYPSMQNRTNRCTLMINTNDAKIRLIENDDPVVVKSRIGSIRTTAEVTDKIMTGVVSLPHGWGHGLPGVGLRVASENPGVSINDITDNKRIDLSGNAAFSALPVSVEK